MSALEPRNGLRALALAALVAEAAGTAGCDRGIGATTRPVEVGGLPTCPSKTTYARPLVVRIDRDQSLFDEAFTTQIRVETPAPKVALEVPRQRMRATVRVGACAPTSIATWDCAAATWLASTRVDFDARAQVAEVAVPKFEAACAPLAPR